MLKVSDTTLENSSCDDGKYLINTFMNWSLISIEHDIIIEDMLIFNTVIETMVDSTIDKTPINEQREPSPQASIDK